MKYYQTFSYNNFNLGKVLFIIIGEIFQFIVHCVIPLDKMETKLLGML